MRYPHSITIIVMVFMWKWLWITKYTYWMAAYFSLFNSNLENNKLETNSNVYEMEGARRWLGFTKSCDYVQMPCRPSYLLWSSHRKQKWRRRLKENKSGGVEDDDYNSRLIGAKVQKLGLSKPTRLDIRLGVMTVATIMKSLTWLGNLNTVPAGKFWALIS